MRRNKHLPLTQKLRSNVQERCKQRISNEVLYKLQNSAASNGQSALLGPPTSASFGTTSQSLHTWSDSEIKHKSYSPSHQTPAHGIGKISKSTISRGRGPKRRAEGQSPRIVSSQERLGFQVKDQAKLLSFLYHRLSNINQGILKQFAQHLIASICPRKRWRYPYKEGGGPPWWPDFIRYETGPHHMHKPDLIPLMIHLLRLNWTRADFDRFNDPKKDESTKLNNGWSVFLESIILLAQDERGRSSCTGSKATSLCSSMREILEVLRAEHDWLCERSDGTAFFGFDDIKTLELPDVIQNNPDIYFRPAGQPSQLVIGSQYFDVRLDDAEGVASDASFVEAMTQENSIKSETDDLSRSFSIDQGSNASNENFGRCVATPDVKDRDSACDVMDERSMHNADNAVTGPASLDRWHEIDDMMLQTYPYELISWSASRELHPCNKSDMMLPFGLGPQLPMTVGGLVQNIQGPFDASYLSPVITNDAFAQYDGPGARRTSAAAAFGYQADPTMAQQVWDAYPHMSRGPLTGGCMLAESDWASTPLLTGHVYDETLISMQ